MFILEGTIGAGKSTLLNLLRLHTPHVTVAFEPLNSWSHTDNKDSLLSRFYTSPQRWAYTLETTTMFTRIQQHIQEGKNKNPYHLMERSVYSGHYVFAQNGYKNGYLSEVEWNMYTRLFDFLVLEKCIAPTGFIYLRTSPDIANTRIKKRARSSETNLSYCYLQNIQQFYDTFLLRKQGVLTQLKNIPVYRIDSDVDFEHDTKEQETLVQNILSFMEESIKKKNTELQKIPS